jgi:hypothetical protein
MHTKYPSEGQTVEKYAAKTETRSEFTWIETIPEPVDIN